MKRPVIGIVLFILLIAPFIASFSWLHYQKMKVRKQVKTQLDLDRNKDRKVLLRFTVSESTTLLRWEHAREFEYQGQMYDVLKQEKRGDTLYYWCWWDQEETRINEQLDELVSHVFDQNPQKKERREKLIDFYKNLYFEKASLFIIQPEKPGKVYDACQDFAPSLAFAPPYPPPESVPL